MGARKCIYCGNEISGVLKTCANVCRECARAIIEADNLTKAKNNPKVSDNQCR